MSKYFLRFLFILSTLFITLTAAVSHAEITGVTVSPSSLNVDTGGQSFNLTWTVTLNQNNALSSQGEFWQPGRDGATDTVNTPLSVTAPSTPTPQAVTIPETLTISTAQLQFWQSLRIQQLQYIRTFEDTQGARVSGSVDINIADGDGGGGIFPTLPTPTASPAPQFQGLKRLRNLQQELQVHRLELRFSDLKSINFVDSGDKLQAQMEISYSGNGMLRGQWQIADPSSTVGEPKFRTLTLINQQLSSVQRSEIVSPVLPTTVEGRYYLRFCVTGIGDLVLPTEGTAECPTEILSSVVGYQVFPQKQRIPLLKNLSPVGEMATAKTLFKWPSVQHATVNQLQILEAPHSPSLSTSSDDASSKPKFITGMLLPGNIREVLLSRYVTEKLAHGQSYYWRISSYGADGKLLARSEPVWFYFVEQE